MIDTAAFEASLALAAARAGDLTPLVYARLFEARPELRAEFWRDTRGAIKGEMLARAFEALLDLAGPRAFADAYIGTELVTHDAYGIPRSVFGDFFAAIADTVAAVAGRDWTPAMAAAWAAVLAEADAILASVPALGTPQPLPDPATGLPAGGRDIAVPHR